MVVAMLWLLVDVLAGRLRDVRRWGHDPVPLGDGTFLCRRCLRPCHPRPARTTPDRRIHE